MKETKKNREQSRQTRRNEHLWMTAMLRLARKKIRQTGTEETISAKSAVKLFEVQTLSLLLC